MAPRVSPCMLRDLPELPMEEPPADRKCLQDRTSQGEAQPETTDPLKESRLAGAPAPSLANRAPKPEPDQRRPPRSPLANQVPPRDQPGLERARARGGSADRRSRDLRTLSTEIILHPKPSASSTCRKNCTAPCTARSTTLWLR